jgi:lysophospholipase L1-like esterase
MPILLSGNFYVFKNRFGNNPSSVYLFKKYMFRFSDKAKLELPIQVYSAAAIKREEASYREAANNPVWQKEYATNIDELILEAKSDGVIPILLMLPEPVFENAPQEVKDFESKDGEGSWSWDSRLDFSKNIRTLQMNLAKKHNTPIIDINKVFDKYNDRYKEKLELFTDDVHLSDKGNTLISQTLLPHIKKIVKEIKTKKELQKSENN